MRPFPGTAIVLAVLAGLIIAVPPVAAQVAQDHIFSPGLLAPRDSVPVLAVGDRAPEFDLPAIDGRRVALADYRGRRHVVLSFVPAAWTPVCSDQWPGYNALEALFEAHDAVVLGITVDNIPTLYAWTREMSDGGGVWFPVLSDFFPHGAVARRYGVLRSDGTSERALFVIDKQGVIRFIDVHDINRRPPLDGVITTLKALTPE